MPSFLKRLLKYCGYFILGFIAFVLLYLLAAWCLSRLSVSKEKDQPEEMAIYIKSNGVHTDIVVPVTNALTDWRNEIKFANTHLTDSSKMHWLAMGWGDKGFYLQTPTWADLKFSVAFNAAFGLSTTAIHATFYDTLSENASCKKIMISNNEYARLITYIKNSFQKDSAGHVMHIVTNANYNDADAFYEANGSYSMFHTCNTWANNALKSCGQKACWWTPFDKGIFYQYK
ncbi:MAG: TIGR02117 family protein [Chitinophagaceae bacterium]